MHALRASEKACFASKSMSRCAALSRLTRPVHSKKLVILK